MTEPPASRELLPPRDAASTPTGDSASSARTAAALAAFALATAQDDIAADAADRNGAASPTPSAPEPAASNRTNERRSRTTRRAAVRPRRVHANAAPVLAAEPRDAAAGESAVEQPVETQSELRNWIKDNATLLSNASLLISISALALNLLPTAGFLDPYIKALIFGAALLLLIEMHHQWPQDLQIHRVRRAPALDAHSWRMVAFAFIMQIATVVFAVWATLTTPLILIPLTALAVVVAFRQWYFRRFRGFAARGFGILALIATLLLSEILMVIAWAVVTDERVTIELWANERPGFTIETSSAP
jgi:hypothetical protein